MEEKRLRLLIPASYGLTFFLGFENGGFQLVLLSIVSDFVVSPAMMGVLVASQYTAITLAPLAFGWIADRIGKKPMLVLFMPVFVAGCFLTAVSGSVPVFLCGVFIIGVGYSVCECIGSSAVSDSFPGRENKYLNIMQCTFSFGAVVSPLFFNWLLSGGHFTWRLVFLLSGCGYVLLYPLVLLARCRKAEPPAVQGRKPASLTLILRSSFFITLLFSMLAYVAMETGVAYFADSLFVWEHNNTELGAYAISAFWFSMGTSRFVFAWLKMKSRTMVLLGFSASTALFVLLLLFRDPWLILGVFAALGAMMGSIWPMIVGIGTSSYQEISGTVASILTAAGGFGGALAPVLIGAVAERWGLYAGFCLLALVSATGFFLMKIGEKQNRHPTVSLPTGRR
jgi:fucose permease